MTETQSTEDKARSEYIAGLRDLADHLETNPHLRLPLVETFAVFCGRDDAVAWVRALPGEKRKTVNTDESHMIFGRDRGVFGPFGFNVWVEREKVCRRVVTGIREVTRTVPAPDAPMVQVTETVEDVEWVCEPLLAEAVTP